MAYFPAFIKMDGSTCLVVGKGKGALRKAEIMREFGADVIHILPEQFEEKILDDKDIVVVTTDDKKRNHEIAQCCKARRIPVNVVDQPEDCTFIFPAYIKKKDVVAAFSSSGKSPVVSQYLKKQMQPILTDELAELTEYLGSIRTEVKERIPSESGRKAFYEELLQTGISKEETPNKEEI